MRTAWLSLLLVGLACGGNNGASDGGTDGGPEGSPDGGSSGPVVPGADTTFGVGGLATLDIGPGGPAALFRVATQPDGSFVAIGATDETIWLVRLKPDGTVDTSFGRQGIVHVPAGITVNGFGAQPQQDLAIQPDGKIVGVARVPLAFHPQAGSPVSGGVVFRLQPDGTLDTTFAGSGYSAQVPGWAVAVGLQSTGGILVSGSGGVTRYTPAGTVDTTFGAAGTASVSTQPLGLSVDSDDSFLAAGGQVLAHVLATGALDNAFGSAGIVQVGTGSDGITAVSRQQDGKILVAGSITGGNAQPSFAVGRYDATGKLDTTFGSSGFAFDPNPSNTTTAYAVRQAPDGSIFASGQGGTGQVPSDQLVQLSSTGTIDTKHSFANFLGGIGEALDPSGVVVAGSQLVKVDPQNVFNAGAIGRFSPTNTGWSGVTPVVAGGSDDRGMALAFASDGSIVVGAYSVPNAGASIARFTPNGALDTTFGSSGVIRQIGTGQAVNALVVQPSGKIVACELDLASSGACHLDRYDATGAPDTSFAGGSLTAGESLIVDPAGNLIVVGGTSEFALQRYSPDGVLDQTFTATTAFGDAAVNLATRAIIQADGRFVVLGATGSSSFTANTSRIVRFDTTGAVDPTFGTAGKVVVSGAPMALAQQSDGKFLTVTMPQYGGGALLVSRFTADGASDATFGTSGTFTMNVDGNDYARLEMFMGMVVQADGHIVVGYANSADGLSEAAMLLRLGPDGAPDTSFGPNGVKSLAAISPGSSAIYAMALDASGRLVMTGRAWSPVGASNVFVLRMTI